jgi:DNA gyrase/topoisomerase IV subunit B
MTLDDAAAADATFDMRMGDNPPQRKDFIVAEAGCSTPRPWTCEWRLTRQRQ